VTRRVHRGAITVVGDEAHVLNYVSILLRATLGKLDISKAGTADEAIALFKNRKPDLVLLDINLIE
jgi:DNA-binding response OmpR family regulator